MSVAFILWAKDNGVNIDTNPNEETKPLLIIIEALWNEIQAIKNE